MKIIRHFNEHETEILSNYDTSRSSCYNKFLINMLTSSNAWHCPSLNMLIPRPFNTEILYNSRKPIDTFYNTVKTLKIGTPKIITIIVLQMEQLDFTVQYCVQKMQTE